MEAAKVVGGAKVAAKATVAVPVLQELWKWGQEHQKLRKERQAEQQLRDRYQKRARSEREQERARFDAWLVDELEPFESELAARRETLGNAAEARAEVLAQLNNLRRALLEKPMDVAGD